MEIIFPVLVFRTAPSVEGFLGPPPTTSPDWEHLNCDFITTQYEY